MLPAYMLMLHMAMNDMRWAVLGPVKQSKHEGKTEPPLEFRHHRTGGGGVGRIQGKKGSEFLLLSNSSILIFLLITAQKIMEIKQLTSRILSTKIWELMKMEVTENQTTEPRRFHSPLCKLHCDINGSTEIKIHQPAR